MSDAEFYKTEVLLRLWVSRLAASPLNSPRAGRVQTFDGWMVVNRELTEVDEHNDKVAEQSIPDLFKDQSIQVLNSEVLKKQTKPPSRYTEASLVTELRKERDSGDHPLTRAYLKPCIAALTSKQTIASCLRFKTARP